MVYLPALMSLLALYWFGGWYWCLVSLPLLLIGRGGMCMWPSLVWLVWFVFTGDRRVFFPFAMYQAVMLGQTWPRSYAAGVGLVIGLFLIIRIEQEASSPVLAVELVVAVTAVCVGALFQKKGRITAAGIASLVAFAGLAL